MPRSPLRAPLLPALMLVGCGVENGVRGRDDIVEDKVFVSETFLQQPLPRVDMLFLIDDTRSMAEEQAALASSFGGLVEELDASELAWHLGVVTTDALRDDAGVLQGNPWIITPLTPDGAGAFARASAVGTGGLGPEAGLAALSLALDEPNRTGANRGFRRPDAALHVVVVSDADDRSDDLLGSDPVTAAEALLKGEAELSGMPALFSAVVGPPGTGCDGLGGVALPGDRYVELARRTDGSVASICSADLAAVIGRMGAMSLSWPRSFALEVEPWQDEVRVSVDGARLDEGWALVHEPPAVLFDEPPAPGAEIVVRYRLPPALEGSR